MATVSASLNMASASTYVKDDQGIFGAKHTFLDIGSYVMDYDIYLSYLCYVLAINTYCIH